MEVVELLKQKGQMLEAKREKEVKVNTLRNDTGQVQKDLKEAKLRLG